MSAPEEQKELPDTPEVDKEPEVGNPPGFLDELLVIVFLLPTLGVFLPQFREDIIAGFAALSSIPEWFVFLIVIGILSVFGFRKQLSEILSNFTIFRKK